MISERKYYEFLYESFIDKNKDLFSNCDISKLESIEIPLEEFNWMYKLLDNVEKKYGFNMQKMLIHNYNKFILWQNNIFNSNDILRIKIAIQFIVFCCLADKILDSARFTKEQKEVVCKKLDVNNFTSEFKFDSDMFQEMDILLNNIREYLNTVRCDCSSEKKQIICGMDRAFNSEIYMYKHPLLPVDKMEKKDVYLLIDKSVQFEIVAFLLATYGENNKKSISGALDVANIFWIIDDLCDFIDDIKARRRNSMLFYCVYSEEKLTLRDRAIQALENANEFISLLEKNINNLKQEADENFYQYVINEVWEWCSNVRKISEEISEGKAYSK